MSGKTTIYLLIILSSVVLIACFGSKINVYKAEKPIAINHANPYTDYWSAFYCGMPEFTDQYTSYNEQKQLSTAFNLIKSGQYESAELILWILQKSPNDTIATAGKKLLNSILFYNSKWADCGILYKESPPNKQKKAAPIYLDYINLPIEKYEVSERPDTIKIEILKGLPILPLVINGRIYRFLIDTGCDITCMGESVAKQQNLKLLGMHSSGVINSIGDYFDITSSVMDSFKIGGTVAYNHPIIITSDNNLTFEFANHSFIKFDGIMGWNYLKNLDFTLDYKKQLLIIKKSAARPSAIKNMFWLSTPIIKLYSKDGIEMNFAFDTGDQVSNFFELLLKKIIIKDLETDLRMAYGVGSTKIVEIKRIRELSLFLDKYELVFNNYESGVEIDHGIISLDGRLGSDLLNYSKIRMDALNNNFEYYRYSVSD